MPDPADASAAVYALTPATDGTPGPEAEQMPPSNIPAAASSIRVFPLIENRLLRESLVRLFRNRTDLLVVGQSGQAGATPCHVLGTQSEVLVADSFLPAWLPANVALQSDYVRNIFWFADSFQRLHSKRHLTTCLGLRKIRHISVDCAWRDCIYADASRPKNGGPVSD